jgi:hypothetical protein
VTTFKAFCVNNRIAMEETAAYTHTFNARVEGAVRIVKEHMRCLLRRANLPRRFWPYTMLLFCRVYTYWPDKQGMSAWAKLDSHGPHALCHDEARHLHRFCSYVTGHLPRTHPLLENETLDDRALEGAWLGNDLSTPMFWMYSFKLRKVVRLSDPRHFRKRTRFRVTASGVPVLVTPDSGASNADIEQAFLQADKLPEGVNGRYFIQPPPGSPDANDRDVVYEVCRPLYGNPCSPRALHKTLDAYFMSEGF